VPGLRGVVKETAVATQYQEELPVVRTVVRRFHVHVGRCQACGRRVQGRHPFQTSNALGAAAAQIGPQAVASAVVLNKQLGLSFGDVATLFQQQYGFGQHQAELFVTGVVFFWLIALLLYWQEKSACPVQRQYQV
jgi:transposase